MSSKTRYLDLPGGRLAYDDTGTGPLIVMTPAMLDLRAELRFIAPRLVATGFRVVTIDQRGMGESSVAWPAYGSAPMSDDLIALIRRLDAGPAVIYGTSNGAAAGVLASVMAPELVRGLILVAPFVRDGTMSWMQRRLMDLMRVPFLTRPLYTGYFPRWEPKRPNDFEVHLAALRANLKEPGRRRVIIAYMLQQSHRAATGRLGEVGDPSLVIMGTGDVDWPNPEAEARWIVERLGSELLLLDGAGHHPHVEYPDEITAAVTRFARRLGIPVTPVTPVTAEAKAPETAEGHAR